MITLAACGACVEVETFIDENVDTVLVEATVVEDVVGTEVELVTVEDELEVVDLRLPLPPPLPPELSP